MPQTLETRVEYLEKKVAELVAEPNGIARKKDWRRTLGIFKNTGISQEAKVQ